MTESGRKYIKYRVPMYRFDFINRFGLLRLRLKLKYLRFRFKNLNYDAQRIGVIIRSKGNEILKVKSKLLGRELKKEAQDEISTKLYGRSKGDIEMMFDELMEKLSSYLKDGSYKSLLNDMEIEDRVIKYFNIFFTKTKIK
jgi:hypothetical protein